MQASELIESATIFMKYHGDFYFQPEHDELYGPGYQPELMTQEDLDRLEELGWFEQDDAWFSFA